ncbi:MAG: ribose-phosphate diphosphokinase [Betaproteobacteria bacterium]|nr:ribose-phosphate diphosphokinase [Betaproteobacteria bacterium]
MTLTALIAGDAHPALAKDIARESGLALLPAQIGAFADGETRVRIDAEVRGMHLGIVQPTPAPVGERLMTLALLADAARAAGAASVTALVPYFGFARQDVRGAPGEPRSAQFAARLLAAAGIERMVTLELHSSALESAFPMPVTQLRADDAVLPLLRGRGYTVVSPDAGGMKRAQRYAIALGAPLAAVAKQRTGTDVAVPLQVLGEVRGATCLLVDDMASTGRTLAGAAQALAAAGATEMHAFFVHAVMAPGALERLRAAGVRRVLTTDSVRPVAEPGVEVVTVAPLFAAALRAGLR